MNDEPNIWTIDIETAPYEGLFWDIWEQNIGLDQITKEWSILAFCAKKLGSSKLVYESTEGQGPSGVRDDRGLLKKLYKILDDADIVIAQNGKKFDIRKITARLLMEGYRPYSPIRVVDTREEAKKLAAVTSTRLEWLSKALTDTPKLKHKKFPGFELWLECLKDNPAAWKEMRRYNCVDVKATEKLYLKLRPWIKGHPNIGAYTEKPHCPKCGSHDQQRRGTHVTQQGRYPRYQCKGCGGWSHSKKSVLPEAARRVLLVN